MKVLTIFFLAVALISLVYADKAIEDGKGDAPAKKPNFWHAPIFKKSMKALEECNCINECMANVTKAFGEGGLTAVKRHVLPLFLQAFRFDKDEEVKV